MTQVIESIEALRSLIRRWETPVERVVLVPTMGNLHRGHLELVDRAAAWGERVIVSIFVNPAQFGEGEDFTSYPRTLEQDLGRLQDRSVDLVFVPGAKDIYPRAPYTQVQVPDLSDILCGEFRPGHFSGVATVVLKLLNIVQPDMAVFGEKDFQQLAVIRKMVADFNLPVSIRAVATVREEDGLAMSSRNTYLSAEQRRVAPLLYRSICQAAREIESGNRDFSGLESQQMSRLTASGFRPDYFSIREAQGLCPARSIDSNLVILAAAWLGKARLIDNKTITIENPKNP